MRGLILLALLTLASFAHADQSDHKFIDVQHDSVRGATCWILNDSAISCLPDSSLSQQATPNPKQNRASRPVQRQKTEPCRPGRSRTTRGFNYEPLR